MSSWEESQRLINGALRVGGTIAGQRPPREYLLLRDTCRSCPRPLRLFGFTSWNGQFNKTCAVCKWKRDNVETTVSMSWRLELFPLPAHIQTLIMTFLCQEGNLFWVPTRTRRLYALSPHLMCVLSTAVSRRWRSILQSDARRLVDWYHQDKGSPRLQAKCIRSPMRDAQCLIQHSQVQNAIWTLALALHYPAKRCRRMVMGRPLTLILTYLSPRWPPSEDFHWRPLF